MQWDPRDVKIEDLPLIVCVDDRRSFLGWVIKHHTHGEYNHIMEMHRPGFFASQDPVGYREVPVESYMKEWITLKFWKHAELSEQLVIRWIHSVQNDLNEPWWKRRYDFLGIVGQLLNIPGLNGPAKYCSEMVAHRLRIIANMPAPVHPTPSQLNELFKTWKEMKVFGRWLGD